MARTIGLYAVAAAVVAGFWLRLEAPRTHDGEAFVIVVLALLPAFVRPWRLRVAAILGAGAVGAWLAFDLTRSSPVSTLADRFSNGLLDFYDYRLPFDPRTHLWMHGVVLAAVFAFCVALGIAIAARRAGLAVALVILGAGWPATLITGGRTTLYGTLILGAALALLAGLARPPAVPVALPAAVVLLVVGVAAAGPAAVAKNQLLAWQKWDFYTRPQQPVSVRYVWNYNYRGLEFPKKVTTVLKIKAPPTSLYWRATTLDDFDGEGWIEDLAPLGPGHASDPLLPARARDSSKWLRADVTIEALRDYHLVGASVPVVYGTGDIPVLHETDGVVVVPHGLVRGDSYSVWSYSPQPKPAQLASLPAHYPPTTKQFLEISPGVYAPRFGTPDRDAKMKRLFVLKGGDATIAPYQPVYEQAKSLVGTTRSPYAAALTIETWLRRSGGFTYDTRPPIATGAPALADFLLQTKRGYCQHFAGAMALMLRYLGIPARVAAGFVSGAYESKQGEWTITDHDAHTWVEVWFPRYGWLPFDPTPGRGDLSAAYTASSRSFNPSDVLNALRRGRSGFEIHQDREFFSRQASAFAHTAGDVPRSARGFAPTNDHPVRNLFRLLALLVAGVLALIVVVKLVLRRSRFLTRDPRRVAAACRRELADFLTDQRIDAPRSATLHELGARVEETLGVEADAFVAAATAARFGPVERAAGAAGRARTELRRLENAIRAQLTRGERARGLLSLRSLGFG